LPRTQPGRERLGVPQRNHLSNRVFDTYDAILDACCNAWDAFIADPERIRSVTAREWAQVNP
jgi:hypothetical protein